jgi:hypothetical protein
MSLYKIFEEGLSDAKKNKPLILTGLACIGVVTTSIVSIFAGKKLQKKDEVVKQKIEEKKSAGEEVTKKDIVVMNVKEKWPIFVPVVAGVGLTCFCTVQSYKESAKKIAGLTVALTATDQAFKSYKKAAEKILGEKEKEVEQEKMKQEVLANPVSKETEQKYLVDKEKQLANNVFNGNEEWWDPLTRQTIYDSGVNIVKAFEQANYRLKNGENFIPWSDVLYEISKTALNGPEIKCDDPVAEEVGWTYDRFGKYHDGIPYDVSGKYGVRIGTGRYVAKIGYKAEFQVSGNTVDYLYNNY